MSCNATVMDGKKSDRKMQQSQICYFIRLRHIFCCIIKDNTGQRLSLIGVVAVDNRVLGVRFVIISPCNIVEVLFRIKRIAYSYSYLQLYRRLIEYISYCKSLDFIDIAIITTKDKLNCINLAYT